MASIRVESSRASKSEKPASIATKSPGRPRANRVPASKNRPPLPVVLAPGVPAKNPTIVAKTLEIPATGGGGETKRVRTAKRERPSATANGASVSGKKHVKEPTTTTATTATTATMMTQKATVPKGIGEPSVVATSAKGKASLTKAQGKRLLEESLEEAMKAQTARCSKATKDPATKQPATKQQATKQPATKQQATKQPATKQPATKQPATKQQATKQQAAKQQAMKQPATKQPATKEQATKEQAAKQGPSSSSSPPCQSAQDRSKILKAVRRFDCQSSPAALMPLIHPSVAPRLTVFSPI
ncbi:unnamed protein product [Closterium sp. NIES-54]